MSIKSLAAVLTLAAAPAFADSHATGNAEAGAALFDRHCVTCHVVQNAAGEVLAGRNAKTGPNLFGILGRAVGSQEGYPYGDSLLAVNATGLTWDEAGFVGYVQDPTDWLRVTLADDRARSKMSWKVRSPQEAADIWAYLASFPAE